MKADSKGEVAAARAQSAGLMLKMNNAKGGIVHFQRKRKKKRKERNGAAGWHGWQPERGFVGRK